MIHLTEREYNELSQILLGKDEAPLEQLLEQSRRLVASSKRSATHTDKLGKYLYKVSHTENSYVYGFNNKVKVMVFWDDHTNQWRRSIVDIKQLKKINKSL